MSWLIKRGLIACVVLLLITVSGSAYASGTPAGGAQLWLRADRSVTVNAGAVSFWADQSGYGNNAFLNNPPRQPSLVYGALNGLPVIRFGGAHQLVLTTPVNPNNFTIFIVGKNNNPWEDYGVILGPVSTWPNNQLRWENGSSARFVGTSNNLDTTAYIGNTRVYHALSVRYDGSVITVYRDGVLYSAELRTTSGPWTLSQIGAWYGSYFLMGDIAEILVYPTALSETDRQTTNAYLRTKYALP